MKAIALLGGPKEEWPSNIKEILRKAQQDHELLIGVDRGSILLKELGLNPDLAIGDFDSLKATELEVIENSVADIRYSNPIKDDTDSELMVKTVFEEYHVSDLLILGATGGRIDHFLVNLLMILNPNIDRFANRVAFLDRQNYLKFYLPGKHMINQVIGYSYFGVAALTAVKNLWITGARYSLEDFSSVLPRVFSSNEFKKDSTTFNLDFDQGVVAVIQSKDLDRYQQLTK